MRRLRLPAAALAALLMRCLPAAVDANGQLATAYRSDIVGPEVWTSTARSTECEGTRESYTKGQVPYFLNAAPKPGLSGVLHVVHETPVVDALSLRIVEEGDSGSRELEWVPVRNRWTPAFCTTYYRNIPARASSTECDWVGDSVLKERKCIDSGNVFIAEATLKNTGRVPRTYEVKVVPAALLLPEGCDATGYAWSFKTTSMGKERARRCSVSIGTSFGSLSTQVKVEPHGECTFRYAVAFGAGTPEEVKAALGARLSAKDPFAANEEEFNGWFLREVPLLATEDADIAKMYVYRWFVVKRNTHEARRVIADHEYPRAAVYESPSGGWYNCVIPLSVPFQLNELSWMRSPAVARAHLLNWCDRVRGYTKLYIQSTAMSAWHLLQNHPDRELAAKIAPALVADAMRRSGGGEKLPVIAGSWPTGAEYQPNFYCFTDPPWDCRHDEQFVSQGFRRARLVRLDGAMCSIGSLEGASRVARMAGDVKSADDCHALAMTQLGTLCKGHWSERDGIFLAADPETGRLAENAACFDSFAPYMWGILKDARYDVAFDKLVDRRWFWDDFPVTTVQKSCPMYFGQNGIVVGPVASPTNTLRYGCCWNGPTWHYSDSRVAEAFGRVASRSPQRRAKWLEFFDGWTRSHFLYGDRTLPRAAEHLRPEDGAHCGDAWDYMHSAWIDPFIRYWCGVSVSDDLKRVCFDPFAEVPFSLENVPLAGGVYSFEQRRDASGGMRRFIRRGGTVLAEGEGALSVEVSLFCSR